MRRAAYFVVLILVGIEPWTFGLRIGLGDFLAGKRPLMAGWL